MKRTQTTKTTSTSKKHGAATKNARWSQHVTQTSNAMDLEPNVFKLDDPRAIAQSLKRSVECSHRRKSPPYRSAQSMLTFYLNRAGKNLPIERKRILEQSKDELRRLFHRDPSSAHARSART